MILDDFTPPPPVLTDRTAVTDADALIADFGDDAGFEAAARADRGRDVGNVLAFARWRQVERLIVWLAGDEAVGTIH